MKRFVFWFDFTKIIPKDSISHDPALVRVMTWRRTGEEPLAEPDPICGTIGKDHVWKEMVTRSLISLSNKFKNPAHMDELHFNEALGHCFDLCVPFRDPEKYPSVVSMYMDVQQSNDSHPICIYRKDKILGNNFWYISLNSSLKIREFCVVWIWIVIC